MIWSAGVFLNDWYIFLNHLKNMEKSIQRLHWNWCRSSSMFAAKSDQCTVRQCLYHTKVSLLKTETKVSVAVAMLVKRHWIKQQPLSALPEIHLLHLQKCHSYIPTETWQAVCLFCSVDREQNGSEEGVLQCYCVWNQTSQREGWSSGSFHDGQPPWPLQGESAAQTGL